MRGEISPALALAPGNGIQSLCDLCGLAGTLPRARRVSGEAAGKAQTRARTGGKGTRQGTLPTAGPERENGGFLVQDRGEKSHPEGENTCGRSSEQHGGFLGAVAAPGRMDAPAGGRWQVRVTPSSPERWRSCCGRCPRASRCCHTLGELSRGSQNTEINSLCHSYEEPHTWPAPGPQPRSERCFRRCQWERHCRGFAGCAQRKGMCEGQSQLRAAPAPARGAWGWDVPLEQPNPPASGGPEVFIPPGSLQSKALSVWGVPGGDEGTEELPLPTLSILSFSCFVSPPLSVDQEIISPGCAGESKLQTREPVWKGHLSQTSPSNSSQDTGQEGCDRALSLCPALFSASETFVFCQVPHSEVSPAHRDPRGSPDVKTPAISGCNGGSTSPSPVHPPASPSTFPGVAAPGDTHVGHARGSQGAILPSG